ncbi:MAG: hypothetical protein R3C60_00810 [Parvularculaceae bacterium]
MLAEVARDLTALSGGVGAADALYQALSPIKSRADSFAIASPKFPANGQRAKRPQRALTLQNGSLKRRFTGSFAARPIAANCRLRSMTACRASLRSLAAIFRMRIWRHTDRSTFSSFMIQKRSTARPSAWLSALLFASVLNSAKHLKESLATIRSIRWRTPVGNAVNGAGLVESAARIMASLKNPQQNHVRRWIAASRVVAGDRRSGGEFLENAEEIVWGGEELLGSNGRADLMKVADDPRQPFRNAANLLRWSLGRSRPVFRTASAREVFKMASEGGAVTPELASRLSTPSLFRRLLRALKRCAARGGFQHRSKTKRALAALCNYADYARRCGARRRHR